MTKELDKEAIANRHPGDGIRPEAKRETGKISDIFGLLKDKTHRRLTIEEINRIAARGWAGER